MNFSLKQIKVFLAVAQTGSITAAAEQVCLTKPAVSMALSELEAQLSYPLFDRINKQLLINDYGRALLPLADELIIRAEEIEHCFDNESGVSGVLRLGASKTIGTQLLPFLIRDFRKQTQQNSQSFLIDNTANIQDKLLRLELDIGLVEADIYHPDIICNEWIKDEMILLCHQRHPLAKIKNLRIKDLENQRWILRELGSGSRRFFLTQIAERLKDWHEEFQLNNTMAIINAVMAELGIACLSRSSLRHIKMQSLKLIPLPFCSYRQYWIIFHKDKYQNFLFKNFLDFCMDYKG